MKVCVAAGGMFHIIDLARQMERLGFLEHLYTGYPSWKPTGLPDGKVSRHTWLTAPAQAVSRLNSGKIYNYVNRAAIENFDRWLAERVAPCDVLHTLSSFGTNAQREARRKYGSLLVCDRGSAHIWFQDEILAEEFDRWQVRYQPIDPVIVQREVDEYQQSDVIVVPSEFALRSFIARGVPARKMAKAPLGVDLTLFRPEPKQDDVFRVLYVGALSLQKGIPYLLDAVRQFGPSRIELTLIGGCMPEMRSFLAEREGTFKYLGIVPRNKLFYHYSQASVFVLPSVQDGFGLVQAQALACGVPVIATQHTGAEDLFTDGVEGFIVPIRDADAIAAKIRLLYERPDLRMEMSRAALERVKQVGGWETYGNRIADIYRSGLHQREELRHEAIEATSVSGPVATVTGALPPDPAAAARGPAARREALPPLRVSVSVGGKFHAFHLVEQLAKRGWLRQFLTTYFNPRSNAWGLDIPRDRVVTNLFPELIARVPTVLHAGPSHWFYRKGELFDQWAARTVEPCDILVGWSGFSLHTIRRMREIGGKVVLVRGSAHILTQKQLVDEENARFGLHQSEVDPLTVEKELREYELADYIAMPSKFCERSFVERGLPREKLRVWPLGADTKRFKPPTEERREGPFRVLYVGEISAQKGIHYLLDAFQRAALPNSELHLVGAVRPIMHAALRNHPASVKVHGVIRFPRLLDYYHNASVFVLPSVQDGFGQVVVQAMATGLPALVSSNAGSSEAVTEGVTGFVFEARNVEALAARLVEMYRDPEMRRQMGRNALHSALRYTWDGYGLAVESSLLEMTGRA